MTASKLGISGDGSYYDAIIIRGYTDSSGGNENALLFSKNTSSVYHSQYTFGSTTTWGTMYKFLDSRNYNNYAAAKSHTHPWSDITSKPDFDQKFIYATSSTYYSYGTTEASGSSSTLTRT